MNIIYSLCVILLRKKFRNCLKMFAVMDDTLEKLGTKMDCEKLKRRILWLVLGWTVTALLLNCNDYIRWRDIYNELTSIYLTFMLNYCTHISIIDDLLFASILGLVKLFPYIKFLTCKQSLTICAQAI